MICLKNLLQEIIPASVNVFSHLIQANLKIFFQNTIKDEQSKKDLFLKNRIYIHKQFKT